MTDSPQPEQSYSDPSASLRVEVVLKRTGERPLAFEGELLAEASTSMDRAHPDWSGETGVSHTAQVWRTSEGEFVVALVRHTAWQGQRDRHEAVVFDTLEEVADWLTDNAPDRVTDPLLEQLGGAVAERI